MIYKSMLTPNSIDSCVQRLKEDEGYEEDRYDNLVYCKYVDNKNL